MDATKQRTAIMVIPNEPWTAPWVLQYEEDSQTARERAYVMAQRRKEGDKSRYKVNGFTY
jgi:hypothetical protein